MNVVIIHYHLDPGGVSQVIRNHLASVATLERASELRIAVVSGPRRSSWSDEWIPENVPVTSIVVPELEYDEHTGGSPGLAQTLQQALLREGFTSDNTLLHWHNANLGKNGAVPTSVSQLADAGYPTLLQIHDFAEDFRPTNYRALLDALDGTDEAVGRAIYPQASHIHYGLLNGRDLSLLREAGVPPERLHAIPNPVAGFGGLPEQTASRQLVEHTCGLTKSESFLLYPVRGIRRKNLGETLALTLLSDQACVGFTLPPPPESVERSNYDHWKQLARSLGMRALFEVTAEGGIPFPAALSAADAIATTSVAEGFGMVFLESWLIERPLVGRDIPEITTDFRDAGLVFPDLAGGLRVPLDLVDRDRLRASFSAIYGQVSADYRRAGVQDSEIERLLDQTDVDFAMLPAALQTDLLTRVAESPRCREQLCASNQQLCAALRRNVAQHNVISSNRAAVVEHYSTEAVGRNVWNVWQQVAGSRTSPITPLAQSEHILNAFLSPQRFHPIRVA